MDKCESVSLIWGLRHSYKVLVMQNTALTSSTRSYSVVIADQNCGRAAVQPEPVKEVTHFNVTAGNTDRIARPT